MEYQIAGRTDTGKVRNHNEDSMASFDSPNGMVTVVCDGMGGHKAGDVASQLAVAVIQDILSNNKFNSPQEAITRSMIAANQAILHRAAQNDGMSGMGSTCVMTIIKDNHVYYGSVGDSRIYYVAEGMIRQLTKDQSYVQTLIDSGAISVEEAAHHSERNQITNALGIDTMEPPVVGDMPISPAPNSYFVLCSDGLSGMVDPNDILGIVLNNSMNLQQKANSLVDLANENGGTDNVTVELIHFSGNAAAAATPANKPAAAGGEAAAAAVKKSKHTTMILLSAIILVLIGGGIGTWLAIDKSAEQEKKEKREKVRSLVPQSKSTPAAEQAPAEQVKTIVVEKEVIREIPAKKTPKKQNKDTKKGAQKKVEEKTKAPNLPKKNEPADKEPNKGDLSKEKNNG